MDNSLLMLQEPQLLFKYSQALEDPRDGLTLFGPLDEGKPFGIRYGVVGTKDGNERFKRWVARISLPVHDEEEGPARVPFWGFETIFQTHWMDKPDLEFEIPMNEIQENIYLDDKYQRVYKIVDLYSSRIQKALRSEDIKVDIWFVIVPDIIYKYCRPRSTVNSILQIQATQKLNPKYARSLISQPSIFPEDNINAIPYQFEVNFHNQLKARLLEKQALTQVIRESTIAPNELPDKFGRPARGMHKLQASAAWNLSTAIFYKVGGRPWKLSGIRDGVCYIGIVFKQLENDPNSETACCAAQMFLDSGDGIVFKGNVGPWYNPDRGDFHLSRSAARELVEIALESYHSKMNGKSPSELFLHGKVKFNHTEWRGFGEAVDKNTNLVGVRIRSCTDIKLFRKGNLPIIRGLAYLRDGKSAYLWTKGYIPRLQTYPGREVPNPLQIDICRGEADQKVVLSDILALTKLNYNACIYGDGLPVTLRFADAVGEILTAGPIKGDVPLHSVTIFNTK